MAKAATAWKTKSGYDTVSPDNAGFALLLENGDNLLLEDGFNLLLEDSVVTNKSVTSWSNATKTATSWEARDGYSSVTVATANTRVTAQGDTRVTPSGDTRVTGTATFTRKQPTEWTE